MGKQESTARQEETIEDKLILFNAAVCGVIICDKDNHRPELPVNVVDEIMYNEVSEKLNWFIGELSPRHKYVIQEYFFGNMTLTEIGNKLGISKCRVAGIRDKALRVLRNKLRKWMQLFGVNNTCGGQFYKRY